MSKRFSGLGVVAGLDDAAVGLVEIRSPTSANVVYPDDCRVGPVLSSRASAARRQSSSTISPPSRPPTTRPSCLREACSTPSNGSPEISVSNTTSMPRVVAVEGKCPVHVGDADHEVTKTTHRRAWHRFVWLGDSVRSATARLPSWGGLGDGPGRSAEAEEPAGRRMVSWSRHPHARTTPVTQDDAGEAKYSAAAATSAGLPDAAHRSVGPRAGSAARRWTSRTPSTGWRSRRHRFAFDPAQRGARSAAMFWVSMFSAALPAP